jgi:MFS transporter, ACS family, glucarate transporter
LLSSLPFVVAVCANLGGGIASDALVKRMGIRKGRRALGAAALTAAGFLTIAAMLTRPQILSLILLSLVYGAITFQQASVFGVCLDIGQKHAGAVVGLMNTSAQVGGLVGSVAYGCIVEHFHSYDAPFAPMAAVLFLGALLWLKIDATTQLPAEHRFSTSPVSVGNA